MSKEKVKKLNLLIVEDHALTRFGLKTCFSQCDFVGNIFEASDAQHAIQLVRDEKISVVIMDLGLPDKDGISATFEIKEINPDLKVIILTSHNDNDEVLAAIKAGACAYCSKEIKPNRLIEVVLTVEDGGAWFDPKVANFVLEATKSNTAILNIQEQPVKQYRLTKREKQVLKLVKEGLTNSQISEELDVSVNTIKAHVSNLLQKLDSEDRVKLALKAVKDKIV